RMRFENRAYPSIFIKLLNGLLGNFSISGSNAFCSPTSPSGALRSRSELSRTPSSLHISQKSLGRNSAWRVFQALTGARSCRRTPKLAHFFLPPLAFPKINFLLLLA